MYSWGNARHGRLGREATKPFEATPGLVDAPRAKHVSGGGQDRALDLHVPRGLGSTVTARSSLGAHRVPRPAADVRRQPQRPAGRGKGHGAVDAARGGALGGAAGGVRRQAHAVPHLRRPPGGLWRQWGRRGGVEHGAERGARRAEKDEKTNENR